MTMYICTNPKKNVGLLKKKKDLFGVQNHLQFNVNKDVACDHVYMYKW